MAPVSVAWRWLVPLVLVGAGLLFAAGASTSQHSALRGETKTRVGDLVLERQQVNADLAAQVAAQRAEIEQLERAADFSPQTRSLIAAAAQHAPAAGLDGIRGPGVRVSLDDAPPLREGEERPDWLTPDDLVVHQQDVESVVNALWEGGADGIQVMDQRLVSTSAVRCVGNTLILQGRVYSPPFTITAVGDPAALRASLDRDPGIQAYREYVEVAGLGWGVEKLDDTTLPAFDGPIGLTYATTPSS